MGKKEAKVEGFLIEEAKKRDMLCYKWGNSGVNGVPDRILIGLGQVFFIECKEENGELSKQQKKRKKEFEQRGIPYFVVKSIEDVVQFFIDQNLNQER